MCGIEVGQCGQVRSRPHCVSLAQPTPPGLAIVAELAGAHKRGHTTVGFEAGQRPLPRLRSTMQALDCSRRQVGGRIGRTQEPVALLAPVLGRCTLVAGPRSLAPATAAEGAWLSSGASASGRRPVQAAAVKEAFNPNQHYIRDPVS